MAKFLSTSGINYALEQLITLTRERLILISPYLKLQRRIRELLLDKDRRGIPIYIVYGKEEKKKQVEEEIAWLRKLEHVEVRYSEHLHAKCYLSEVGAIITSMNLYEFSQVNNEEMGILITPQKGDTKLYRDTLAEVERILRFSEEILVPSRGVDKALQWSQPSSSKPKVKSPTSSSKAGYRKLTTYRLAQARGMTKAELLKRLAQHGYLVKKGQQWHLTAKGKQIGAEERPPTHHGKDPFFLWPRDLEV